MEYDREEVWLCVVCVCVREGDVKGEKGVGVNGGECEGRRWERR